MHAGSRNSSHACNRINLLEVHTNTIFGALPPPVQPLATQSSLFAAFLLLELLRLAARRTSAAFPVHRTIA